MGAAYEDIRVLIIAEDARTRNYINKKLSMMGMDVDQATSGFHALYMLEKKNYTLALVHNKFSLMMTFEIVSLIKDRFVDDPLNVTVFGKIAVAEAEEFKQVGADKVILDKGSLDKVAMEFQAYLKELETDIEKKRA